MSKYRAPEHETKTSSKVMHSAHQKNECNHITLGKHTKV
jgi:hypothetical protein